jgi:hypothetical protein
MSHSYLTKYRTFDEVMEAVRVDLPKFQLEGHIKPEQLIKVVQYVNSDLGLRIHQTEETIIEVSRNKAKLPDNFFVLNNAILLGDYSIEIPKITGRQTEDVIIYPEPDEVVSDKADCKNCRKVALTPCGDFYQVVEKRPGSEVRTYKTFQPLELSSSKYVGKNCINIGQSAPNKATIRDGHIFTNFPSGSIYLHYEGDLIDEDGNLLVIDHARVNEYYEYALKERILENMLMDGEPIDKQLQYVLAKKTGARNNALAYVNTPDFAELKKIWEINRRAMHHKYFSMFQ